MVLYGATGYVGQLAAAHLASHAPPGLRIGLAGRSQDRLAAVRSRLGVPADRWPLIRANSGDPASLAQMAAQAAVVASTVGPYRRNGLALVRACAEAGTDYADLTGEVLFIRDSIDKWHTAAQNSGARVVHCCGFDSIPSDLGVLLLHQAAAADGAGGLTDTTLVVRAMKGGLSGGTIASMKNQLDEVRSSPRSRAIAGDPYALSPDRASEPGLGNERDLAWPRHDPELGWLGPFLMAGINTRVVRRSNALLGWAYGRAFRYTEAMGMREGPAGAVAAAGLSAATMALTAGLVLRPTRAVLDRVLPAPGAGPSERARRAGFFRIDIHARTSSGARYLARVGAQGDPGYAATSVMLGEAALGLALDRDRLPERAGVLTPATALGPVLIDRLRTAGMRLTVQRSGD